MDNFQAWLDQTEPEINHVRGLLEENLSDNPMTLYIQLTKVEVWQSRLVFMLADANSFLSLAEYDQISNLPDGLIAEEKRLACRAATRHHRRIRDIIDGLIQASKNRIILGMNLRKGNNAESSNFQS